MTRTRQRRASWGWWRRTKTRTKEGGDVGGDDGSGDGDVAAACDGEDAAAAVDDDAAAEDKDGDEWAPTTTEGRNHPS